MSKAKRKRAHAANASDDRAVHCAACDRAVAASPAPHVAYVYEDGGRVRFACSKRCAWVLLVGMAAELRAELRAERRGRVRVEDTGARELEDLARELAGGEDRRPNDEDDDAPAVRRTSVPFLDAEDEEHGAALPPVEPCDCDECKALEAEVEQIEAAGGGQFGKLEPPTSSKTNGTTEARA
jgi:hypothetical protein